MGIPTTVLAGIALAAGIGSAAMAAPALPEAAQEALTRALEDEYHAEAFYAAVIDAYGPVRPFVNIVAAERQHAGAVTALMDAYGIVVPENAMLGSSEIAAAVPASLAEACQVGVEAEIENRTLYDAQLIPAVSAYPDIVNVMEALRDASENNHLPAFTRCAGR
ncbi:ferritin-like domain-containing protein [Martelella radicis]|uniref:DUF2202 domain-containing protein n=1 Tax=Martelella radicis TaxID=1397476 RepID=A0A7W6KK80_9HYPH|nr:DUF2202 domain-containing protein [Martelella radicis]MBB4121699.1 hypothetical protein [Martelella radicis]